MGSGGDLPRWMRGADNTAGSARSAGSVGVRPAGVKSAQRRGSGTPASAGSATANRAGSVPAVGAVRVEPEKRKERTAPTSAREAKRPAGGALLGSCLSMLGILLGLVFVIGSVGFFAGSLYLTDILETISKRNYIGQTERFDKYRDYFAKLSASGFEVDESRPTIVQGRTTYSWSIRPRGSTDTRSFEWDHDLETNTITPRTNGALLMDIRHKYLKEADAAASEFYNPDDKLAQAIVAGSVAEISQILGEGWSDSAGEGGLQPPLAPLTDPAHPKRKNGGLALPGEDPEEEEEALAAAAAGNVAEGTGAGESIAVGGEEGTPEEDPSVEVGGTGEEAGGQDSGDGSEGEGETGAEGEQGGGLEGGGEDNPDEGGTGDEGTGDDSTPVD